MMWTCPRCGAVVDGAVDRCWACKHQRPEPEPALKTKAVPVSEFNTEAAPTDEVSESGPGIAPPTSPDSPFSSPSETAATGAWVCSKCGETVDAGFQVCWSCGTSLDGVEDPEFENARETAASGDCEELKPSSAPWSCIRCQGPLEAGFVADYGHGHTMYPSEWVSGTPTPSFLIGTRRGDRRYPIRAFRCGRCGRLEFWAGESDEED